MSGVEYVFAASHVPRPDVASAPVNETESAWLYQPFSSARRPGEAVVCGAVASYLSPKDALRTFPAWSLQLPETAAVALSGPE